jgi:hypothetical protein
MAYRSFENLEVWQRGCRLSVAVYNAFKYCRRFSLKGLFSQNASKDEARLPEALKT